MTVSFASVGAVAAGNTTPAAVALPASIANTDSLLVMFQGCKPNSRVAVPDSGFTLLLNNNSGGAGSNSVDTGAVRSSIFSTTWDGVTTTASVPWSVGGTPTSPSPGLVVIGEFRKTNAGAWQLGSAAAADITASDGLSLVATTDPGYAAGDMVAVVVMAPTDSGTWDTPVITIPGCTVGTATLVANAVTTAGNDGRLGVVVATVASGASSGNATLTINASGGNGYEQCGSAVFARLRELQSSRFLSLL